MLPVWRRCRPGRIVAAGLGAAFHATIPAALPEAGGVLDQAAIMLEALDIMDDAAAQAES